MSCALAGGSAAGWSGRLAGETLWLRKAMIVVFRYFTMEMGREDQKDKPKGFIVSIGETD
ncbi:hypothetical protein QWZ10_24700 [Paracoccus cavernae]|uniref:Uncharacterized protein n=1 Tax=Paracoccus cavernae TaxID=1571207 RepID=A0ABT8DBN2_9RHOB|nr:hypothetical protein [Paracoccus cavernae]MDN3714198.1 hypothetical protein [Paracoccus cavernae]